MACAAMRTPHADTSRPVRPVACCCCLGWPVSMDRAMMLTFVFSCFHHSAGCGCAGTSNRNFFPSKCAECAWSFVQAQVMGAAANATPNQDTEMPDLVHDGSEVRAADQSPVLSCTVLAGKAVRPLHGDRLVCENEHRLRTQCFTSLSILPARRMAWSPQTMKTLSTNQNGRRPTMLKALSPRPLMLPLQPRRWGVQTPLLELVQGSR